MLAVARLFFPLPLLIVGATGVTSPWLVMLTVVLAVAPMVFPKMLLGRPPGAFYFTGALTLFVIGALVGVMVSFDPLESLPLLLTILGSVSLMYVVANPIVSPRTITVGVTLLGAAFALYFATQYAHFQYPLERGTIARIARSVSSLFPAMVFLVPHPNAAATFLEGTFFLAIALAQSSKSRQRWFWWGVVGVVVYGLFISDSRGAALGVLLGVALWTMLQVPKTWRPPLAMLGGIILGVVGSALALTFFAGNSVVSPLVARAIHGFGGRYTLYRNSIELLHDYLFTGLGLGNAFAMVYSRYQLLIDVPFLYYAHNLPLAVWLGQGLLGIIGLGWLVVAFFRLVWKVERYAPHIPHRTLFRGSWLGVTATLTHGLFDAAQFSPDHWTMPLLFALLGLTIVLARRALRTMPKTEVGTKTPDRKWVLAALIAALVVMIAFSPKIMAQWRANVGSLYQTYAELAPDDRRLPRVIAQKRARQIFETVLQTQPENAVANRRLGMMALDAEKFELAVAYLQKAYRYEPHNQPTLKALGYAYLWTGHPVRAAELFRQVEFRSRLVDELHYYQHYWATQNRDDLSALAAQMAKQLRR